MSRLMRQYTTRLEGQVDIYLDYEVLRVGVSTKLSIIDTFNEFTYEVLIDDRML